MKFDKKLLTLLIDNINSYSNSQEFVYILEAILNKYNKSLNQNEIINSINFDIRHFKSIFIKPNDRLIASIILFTNVDHIFITREQLLELLRDLSDNSDKDLFITTIDPILLDNNVNYFGDKDSNKLMKYRIIVSQFLSHISDTIVGKELHNRLLNSIVKEDDYIEKLGKLSHINNIDRILFNILEDDKLIEVLSSKFYKKTVLNGGLNLLNRLIDEYENKKSDNNIGYYSNLFFNNIEKSEKLKEILSTESLLYKNRRNLHRYFNISDHNYIKSIILNQILLKHSKIVNDKVINSLTDLKKDATSDTISLLNQFIEERIASSTFLKDKYCAILDLNIADINNINISKKDISRLIKSSTIANENSVIAFNSLQDLKKGINIENLISKLDNNSKKEIVDITSYYNMYIVKSLSLLLLSKIDINHDNVNQNTPK
jgi:hypothetical protein